MSIAKKLQAEGEGQNEETPTAIPLLPGARGGMPNCPHHISPVQKHLRLVLPTSPTNIQCPLAVATIYLMSSLISVTVVEDGRSHRGVYLPHSISPDHLTTGHRGPGTWGSRAVNEGKMKRIRMQRSTAQRMQTMTKEKATSVGRTRVEVEMERLILMDRYVWFQPKVFLIFMFMFILHCRLNRPLRGTLQNVDMARPCLVRPYRPRVRPPLKHDHIMPTLASHQEICRHARWMENANSKNQESSRIPITINPSRSILGSMSSEPFRTFKRVLIMSSHT
jgi:hypothetical protein